MCREPLLVGFPSMSTNSGQLFGVGEQGRGAAGMPEQHGFAALEHALTNQINQPAERPSGVNRVALYAKFDGGSTVIRFAHVGRSQTTSLNRFLGSEV